MSSDPQPEPDPGILSELEDALDRRDVDPALGALRRLQAGASFLDEPEAGERFERLTLQAVQLLFAELDVEAFVATAHELGWSARDVYPALDGLPELPDVETLLTLADGLGLPTDSCGGRLRARLLEDPGDRVTKRLDAWIRARSAREREDGESMAAHARTMSTFRYVRWLPDDQGLSDAVGLLHGRADALARRLRHAYLLELPWGPDRLATATLLSALQEDDEVDPDLFREALEVHAGPVSLRLWLLSALALHDVDDAQRRVAAELAAAHSDDDRIEILDRIWDGLSHPGGLSEPEAGDAASFGRALESIETRSWGRFARGYLGVVLATRFPGTRPSRVSGATDRGLLYLVRWFGRLRLDHMGCVITLPLLFGLGQLLLFLLDLAIGKAGSPWDDILLGVWLLAAAGTSHTHFSGHETLRQRLVLACVYFGTFLLFVAMAVWVRLSVAAAAEPLPA